MNRTFYKSQRYLTTLPHDSHFTLSPRPPPPFSNPGRMTNQNAAKPPKSPMLPALEDGEEVELKTKRRCSGDSHTLLLLLTIMGM